MIVIKSVLFDELINDMSKCQKCLNRKKNNTTDCSLINIYKNPSFAKKIPSIWTDWYRRLDSKIMIIGQDWGPYSDMQSLNTLYLDNPTNNNWDNLIEKEESLTKKQLTKYLVESSNGKISSLNNIYITNAIMCARSGNNYRGNNIDLKHSSISCSNYLLRQIKIVNPQVILTLGYYPLFSLSKIFSFKIEKTLKQCIETTPIIKVNDYIIIPLYHPVAQITKENQLKQYKRIWQ